jgi:hypothetical protein
VRPGRVLDAWVECQTAAELAHHLHRLAVYPRAYPPQTRAALFREIARRLLQTEIGRR